MVPFLFHIRFLVFFFILIQSISLYKINLFNPNQLDASSSSSFNDDDMRSPIDNKNFEYEDDLALKNKNIKIKRSSSLFALRSLPQRRSSRPHWNPLVAAYKRCAEYTSYEEREACFKNAVQILFVHKLRK